MQKKCVPLPKYASSDTYADIYAGMQVFVGVSDGTIFAFSSPCTDENRKPNILAMKTLDDFRQFFAQQLSQELAAAESARKGTIVRAFLVWVFAVPITGLVVWGTTKLMGQEYLIPLIILNVLVFSFLAYMLWREVLSSRRFYNLFKGRVIDGIIRYVDDRLHYIPHRYVSANTVVSSRLFGKPIHKYEGDDYCFMQLEDSTFVGFSEVHAFTTVKEDGKKRSEPIFEGLFAHVKLAEPRGGDLYILPKGVTEADLYQPGRVQTHTTEDMEFDKNFTVYANLSSAVRRYLTPSLISAIKAFHQRHPDRLIYYASHGNSLYVALSSPSHLFEPNVWESLAKVETLEQFFLDLNELMGILRAAADLSGASVAPQAQPA